MVVVPTCSSDWISRYLDSRARAIIVLHVDNVEQAKICVNASKFPPLVCLNCSFRYDPQIADLTKGHHSVTMVTAMPQYKTELSYAEIVEVVNEEVMIMPMIETEEGVENVEAIAAIPGIDSLLIGCANLCMEYVFLPSFDPIYSADVNT